MPASIYDTLPEAARAQYPLDQIDPSYRDFLTTPLPNGYPADRAARFGAAIAQRLPGMTRAATRGSEMATVGRALHAETQPGYAMMSPLRRIALQAAEGFLSEEPTTAAGPSPYVERPLNGVEEAARMVGGAAGFTGKAALLTLAGVPPTAAAGVAAAANRGTPSEHAIRSAETAAIALLDAIAV